MSAALALAPEPEPQDRTADSGPESRHSALPYWWQLSRDWLAFWLGNRVMPVLRPHRELRAHIDLVDSTVLTVSARVTAIFEMMARVTQETGMGTAAGPAVPERTAVMSEAAKYELAAAATRRLSKAERRHGLTLVQGGAR